MKSRSGFTIVEIIVVIVVLGILATIVTVSLVRLQTEQRDARRQTTASLIMESLEKYYDKNGEYPYREELNPTGNKVQMPNYDAVTARMPQLTADILTTEGYIFMPWTCPAPNTSCSSTAEERAALPKQFVYYNARVGDTGSYIGFTDWGCRVVIATDNTPAALLAWREEQTGKWNFIKTKRGNITIEVLGVGPTAPTQCVLSNAP